MRSKSNLLDVHGAARLAVDAALVTTDVVEQMHRTIQQRPHPLGMARTDATRGITGLVYRNVRGVIGLVGQAVDACLPRLADHPEAANSSPARDARRSVLNGVYGDYLVQSHNPLAIPMTLRHAGRELDLNDCIAKPRNRLLVLAHGLCMNEQQWCRDGHDHGAVIARELGFTPLHLRYNSGLAIWRNGQELAQQLEIAVGNWPRAIDEVAIVGHSMGGLVARSACHYGQQAGHAWPRLLSKLVFLGTPHHGAPLERLGNAFEMLLDLSPYSMPLTRISRARSAGIEDLRGGAIVKDQQHVPLPEHVDSYAIAAVMAKRPNSLQERLIGDGLVPLDSALGRHRDPGKSLKIAKDRQWIGYGIGHLALLRHPEVYAQLRRALA